MEILQEELLDILCSAGWQLFLFCTLWCCIILIPVHVATVSLVYDLESFIAAKCIALLPNALPYVLSLSLYKYQVLLLRDVAAVTMSDI